MSLPLIEAYSYGGWLAEDSPFIVIHSVESDIKPGIAESLARWWFGEPEAGTSAHQIFDPSAGVQMVPRTRIAWHCGPMGNPRGTGREHAGRAAMTRAEWMIPLGLAMLRLSARDAADEARARSIPLRWLSLTQVARGERGFCTHWDITRALGGTTHTDPGPNFPYDIYMSYVQAYYNGTEPMGDDDVPALSAADRAQLYNNGKTADRIQATQQQILDAIAHVQGDVSWAHARNMATQDHTSFIIANHATNEWRWVRSGVVQPEPLTSEEATNLLNDGLQPIKLSDDEFKQRLALYAPKQEEEAA